MITQLFKFIILLALSTTVFGQTNRPHANAHAHNDYRHKRPLLDALENGFTSVEADVHWFEGKLVVAHDTATASSPTLEKKYFAPLDSVVKINKGLVYPGSTTQFFLMIDIKTKSELTYSALKELLKHYPRLNCTTKSCAVKIFLSGERPLSIVLSEGYMGFGIDGRPEDIGKGYASQWMPVISDTYENWATWKGQSPPGEKDLERIKELANRVHSDGKKLRLWAIPDNSIAWQALLDAGVDFINSDRLRELNLFLTNKDL